MKIDKFSYGEKMREVIITEETDQSIKGWDISYCEETDREKFRKIAESLEDPDEESLAQFKSLSFRHFKKDRILRDEKESA